MTTMTFCHPPLFQVGGAGNTNLPKMKCIFGRGIGVHTKLPIIILIMYNNWCAHEASTLVLDTSV